MHDRIWAAAPWAVEMLDEISDPMKMADVSALGYSATGNRRGASYRRGPVAVLKVHGPLLAHDSSVSELFGMTTYESMSAELADLREDPTVRGVVLSIDSVGGDVSGLEQVVEDIRRTAAVKPLGVVAHVSGVGASAAYWIASAADKIIVESAAQVGSIGAVYIVRRSDSGNVEFVSSVSPLKRPNPDTESGRDQYQATVDAIGEVFVAAVAKNRSVSEQTVIEQYGRGGVLVGQAAVDAGMVDGLGTLEDVIRQMTTAAGGQYLTEGKKMSKNKELQAAVEEEAVAQDVATTEKASDVDPQAIIAAERERVRQIMAALDGTGMESRAAEYIEAGADLAQVHSDLVAFLKDRIANQSKADTGGSAVLDAMRRESEVAAAVEGGGVDISAREESAEKEKIMKAWAEGAQSVVTRGRRVVEA